MVAKWQFPSTFVVDVRSRLLTQNSEVKFNAETVAATFTRNHIIVHGTKQKSMFANIA